MNLDPQILDLLPLLDRLFEAGIFYLIHFKHMRYKNKSQLESRNENDLSLQQSF